jgi:hypothetical protein
MNPLKYLLQETPFAQVKELSVSPPIHDLRKLDLCMMTIQQQSLTKMMAVSELSLQQLELSDVFPDPKTHLILSLEKI